MKTECKTTSTRENIMDIAALQYNVQVLKDLLDNATRVKKLTMDAYYQASLSYDQAVHMFSVANQQLDEAINSSEVQS